MDIWKFRNYNLDNNSQTSQNKKNISLSAEGLREKLQQDIVSLITKRLESGEMSEDRAKAIARMTLEKMPKGISYDQLMKTLPGLDDEFEELRIAIFPVIKDYQIKVSKKVGSQISQLMQQKRYKDALKLARKAVDFESKLG